MITDLERNDLGAVCEYGSVHVKELLKLEGFEQVAGLLLQSVKPGVEPLERVFIGGCWLRLSLLLVVHRTYPKVKRVTTQLPPLAWISIFPLVSTGRMPPMFISAPGTPGLSNSA